MDNPNYGSSLESALNCVRDSSPILTALWPSPFQSTPKALDLTQIFLDISLNQTASRALTRLEGDQAQAVLDALQASAPRHQGNWNQHLRILCLLLRLAKLSSLYPRSVLLEGVTREGAHALTAGHFGEIWKGSFRGESVCVKVLKVYQRGDINKLLNAFTREALLWNHMRHDNVLPFQGIHRLPGDEAGRIALISPWMENGNIVDYLARCPMPDRYALARDVCEGLAYLHKQDIIHGDLKGVNILVDGAGRARVADFGLSFIVQSEILRWTASTTTVSQGGTVRWQAPELFNPEMEDAKSTKLTDIYSLGCVFYEIFTGQIPFYEVQKEYTVISFVLSGKQPSRPSPGSKPFTDWGLTETFWTMCIEGCWNREPQGRPQLSEVLSSLSSTSGQAVVSPISPTDLL
ncbi:kinase-like domain-containing protein [Ephemerocybe angulata]|uniref:Kinase-like domain-containing protein n=1 Tax=Ephemerocybe angulata TaxID=980116 RepID=A0A8H6HP17_9AGAR|nr:kinase-like domain-containing protein [Tulosesus angulatus]